MYDIPPVGGDLFAAFVITKQGPAFLDSLDPSKALVSLPVTVIFRKLGDLGVTSQHCSYSGIIVKFPKR